MSIIAELKRRNVFKVGTAYVVAAWLIIQFSDILLDNMDAPSWVLNAIMLLLGIGFMVTLFVAWAFEVTPEGIKRESEVDRSQSITPQTGKKLNNAILVLMALAIAYLLFDKFSAPKPASTPAAETAQIAAQQDAAPAAEPEVSRQSIAVLPFDNRSNREEDQFFTDGIHDDLLTTIARIGSMKVISRTSVMEYKGTTKKIPEIARELGVANILEGGIQRSGNQVRINVQLIDAQTDEHLWAEIFDRELTAENLFAIQSEISSRIAEALETTLSPQEQERINRMPTQNLEAYNAYLRGKQLMATRRVEDLEAATKEFLSAVELDPDFALAWVGVADSHALLTAYSNRDAGEFAELRREAVDRAMELDPLLGEAYTAEGSLHLDINLKTGSETELEQAFEAFRKAAELSPNYATNYHWWANAMGFDPLQSRERLDLVLKAVELDPRSMIIGTTLANEYYNQGLFSRAAQQVRTLIERDPDFPNAYHQAVDHHLFYTSKRAKALANAEKLLEIDARNTDARRHQIEVYVEVGKFEKARAIQQEIVDQDPDDIFAVHADLLIALQTNNKAAVLEGTQWQMKFVERWHFMANFIGGNYLSIGETERALEMFFKAHPWSDPGAWDKLVREAQTGGCTAAWLMIHEGDEELGRQLLERALTFQERELPAAVEHADRWSPEICYLANGDTEKALVAMETQMEHGHVFGWIRQTNSPIYDPIRLDPRFLAMRQEYDRLMAEQRELIEAGGVEPGA
ncbi:MAG: tetratricopeptide repeat protein [Xanthomonadales bacterium]|nr:tetratricopeptide repeat protein [Xanthomonadales bacterium]